MFYQLGKIPFYSLQVETYEYSHEEFDTDNLTIDNINIFSGNELAYELLLENGNKMLLENNSNIIMEGFSPENYDSSANNELFYEKATNVVDFSEKSPFINYDSNFRF